MGKIVKSKPVVYDPPPYTAKQQESDFKKSYEFQQAAPVRSPVKGWEYNYIRTPSEYSQVPAQETRIVKGTPHAFKGVREGNSYGKRSAMRRNLTRKGM